MVCVAALAAAAWFWTTTPGAGDRAEIRRLLRARNAALQAGNGARYDALLYYPGIAEKTAAFGVARAVSARAALLRAVAARWSSDTAVRTGQQLPALRELDPREIDSCPIHGRGSRAGAEIRGSAPVEFRKTPEGWKLDVFGGSLPALMSEFERASVIFDAARAEIQRGRVKSAEEALRGMNERFAGGRQRTRNGF